MVLSLIKIIRPPLVSDQCHLILYLPVEYLSSGNYVAMHIIWIPLFGRFFFQTIQVQHIFIKRWYIPALLHYRRKVMFSAVPVCRFRERVPPCTTTNLPPPPHPPTDRFKLVQLGPHCIGTPSLPGNVQTSFGKRAVGILLECFLVQALFYSTYFLTVSKEVSSGREQSTRCTEELPGSFGGLRGKFILSECEMALYTEKKAKVES